MTKSIFIKVTLTCIIVFIIKKSFVGHNRDYPRRNDDRERSKVI